MTTKLGEQRVSLSWAIGSWNQKLGQIKKSSRIYARIELYCRNI